MHVTKYIKDSFDEQNIYGIYQKIYGFGNSIPCRLFALKKSLIELKKKCFGDFNHMEIKQAALHGNMLIKHYTYH